MILLQNWKSHYEITHYILEIGNFFIQTTYTYILSLYRLAGLWALWGGAESC